MATTAEKAFEQGVQSYRQAQRGGNFAGVSARALRAVRFVWPSRFVGQIGEWEMDMAVHALFGARLMTDVDTEDDHLLYWAHEAIGALRDAAIGTQA